MVSLSRKVVVSVVALGTAAAVGSVPPTSSAAGSAGVTVVARSLDGPFGLQKAGGDRRGFVVAESESGQVTRVYPNGNKYAILGGVPGVAGVAATPRRVYAVIGGPNEEGSPSGGRYGPARVLRMDHSGRNVKVIANLLRHERLHNPDGQVQFVNGQPVDALSNPFAMTASRYGLFVADGGANDVLRVNPRTGKITTFFVPPNVRNVADCRGPNANANPGTRGCDSVPTGVAVVGRNLYVSTLGGEARGAGRIYKVSARTGKIKRVWGGFTGPTGVAARRDGTIYFSEVLEGAPQGEPGPNFDPSTIGRITRIRNGQVTRAEVTMPIGLVLKDGRLFSTAWSVGFFLGIPHAGQVVRVRDSAFN